MIAPILLRVALTAASGVEAGTTTALWICFGISVGGALAGISLYALGRVRPATPAFEQWLAGERPAWESPPLLAGIRRPPTEAVRELGADDDARNRRLLHALNAACGASPSPQPSVPEVIGAGQTGQQS
jgi:hypothetical protein